MAIVNAAFYFLSVIYLPFIAAGSPNTKIYLQVLYIVIAIIFSYLFVILKRLLEKIRIDNVSANIHLIIISYLASATLEQLMYASYSGSSFSSHPELGLVLLGYTIIKIILGIILIKFASKLNKQKNKPDFLESYPGWIKISGALYIIAGITGGGGLIFSVIASLLLAISMQSLFLKAAKDTEKSSTEAENVPT